MGLMAIVQVILLSGSEFIIFSPIRAVRLGKWAISLRISGLLNKPLTMRARLHSQIARAVHSGFWQVMTRVIYRTNLILEQL
ncbi:hypothetical protein DWB58_31275 [candidate division KSB1 bacterium]|nr:hypothetical protein [candidate division KSB1 bacterium]